MADSRNVAAVFRKRERDVARDIDNLLESLTAQSCAVEIFREKEGQRYPNGTVEQWPGISAPLARPEHPLGAPPGAIGLDPGFLVLMLPRLRDGREEREGYGWPRLLDAIRGRLLPGDG